MAQPNKPPTYLGRPIPPPLPQIGATLRPRDLGLGAPPPADRTFVSASEHKEAIAAAATAKETELPKASSKEPISHEHSYGFMSTPELLAAAIAADDQIERSDVSKVMLTFAEESQHKDQPDFCTDQELLEAMATPDADAAIRLLEIGDRGNVSTCYPE